MVRSVEIAAVIVGLAWTGLAGAQSSASPQTKAAERYITVREEGKPPQRCLLLKNWREPNGVPVFQVRAVDTGEVMTIVGSGPPAQGGNPRAMSTRIFHWGRDNKPPAGSPTPPSTTGAMAPPKTMPAVTTPQPKPAALTAQKPNLLPLPSLPAPPPSARTAAPPVVATPKPAKPIIAPQAPPVVQGKPTSRTPMDTPIIQPRSDRPHAGSVPAPSQPRLTPSAAGTVAGSTPCGACCPPSCNPCGQTCNPCCQSSCVCCTTSPMKQSFFSRLFKPHRPCACPPNLCQPMPAAVPAPNPAAAAVAVAKVATEPAKPRDWRESWGKVEPWNGAAQANNNPKGDTLTGHATPPPVPLTSPQPLDPLKQPDLYRGMAMSARPTNNMIPAEGEMAAAPQSKSRLFGTKRSPAATPPAEANASPPVPPPTQAGGRAIQLPANEANAFWTPPQPPPGPPQERPKFNAFDRDSNSPPPQGVPPAMAGGPRVPMPPRGPMPMVAPPIPQMPPMVNTGVPDALGNAFTVAGTRRPIPADFGGTPQEPNGFGDAVPQMQGQGLPPRAYGMAPPPMANQMAMASRMPMGVNPLMNAPPAPAAAFQGVAAARPSGVPQLLTALKDSLRPSQREEAAEQLSELDWHMQPQVVESLMKSARSDPAATVRAACIHALAHMQVNTTEATALVRNLKSDRDPRVRQEAEEALSTLGDSGIQPASHR